MDNNQLKINPKSLQFVRQLIKKTEEGLVYWTMGFEDGQYKTLLGDGELAFVVQVNKDKRRFQLLDDHLESILDEELDAYQVQGNRVSVGTQWDFVQLYDEIGELQELARTKVLKVDERLVKAEEILASLR